MKMANPHRYRYPQKSFLLLLLLLLIFPHRSRADIGFATEYQPPYIPTTCYGNDESKFPTNGLFAAAGEGIWDNGASCGRQYLVRCISAEDPTTCKPEQTIQIQIVDQAATLHSPPTSTRQGASFVLSPDAYGLIADPKAPWVNIEFDQV